MSSVTESIEEKYDMEIDINDEIKNSRQSSEDLIFDLKNKEKKELAEKIRKENENFMKSIEETKIERLKFLLKQTEIFAHFLVGTNSKTKEENIETDKKQGKASKAKRNKGNTKKDNINLLKSLKREMDDGDDNEFESPQVTRLFYQPSYLTGGKLTEYQLDGLNWLISLYENGLNGILADEMGLGKTIQSIAFMSFLKQYKKKNGYFLVVVPKSTMPNWGRELKLWCPNLNVLVLNPVKEEREETLKLVSKLKFEVLVTSYEGVNLCISKLRKVKWECLIIDEAHRIKNENALLSKNVRMLESKFRLLVTGTPLQNNLHELWALLNFLLPDLFSSAEDFDEWFGLGNKDEENLNVNDQEEKNMEIVQQLHKILKPFLLRRTKSEVEKTLPPKKEIHIKVGLTENQKNLYKKLLTSSLISDSKTIYKNIIMQLRKVCNHPYLFEGVEDEGLPEIGDHLINVSSKMRILDKLLTKLKQQGSQVLIFSQMTRMLDIIEDYCTYKEYISCRIDGDSSLEQREFHIQEFTKPNSPIFLFLLSTRAGGLGLNLMTADTVVLYDSDWNPQVDLQAMDRVHRIGQTRPVLIYRFISENTIEEKIIERQAMRLKLDSLVIQQGRVLKGNETFTKDQMKEMIQYGADAIFRAGDDFKDEDIEFILERGEKNTNLFYEQADRQAKDRSNLLINMSFNPSDLYKFENEDYLIKRKEESDKVLAMVLADERNDNDMRLNRRDRTKNNNIDYNVDQLLQGKNMKKKSRAPKIPYWHLYSQFDKLYDLKQKQINFFLENNKKLPEKFDDDLNIYEGLTEEETIEMIEILAAGFPQWEKKDYETMTKTIDKYGRNCLENLAEELNSKTLDEIKNYYNSFWEKINELPDGPKLLRNIEKREKSEKQRDLSNILISKKVTQAGEIYENIKITYPNNSKQSEFSLEEDQFMVYLSHKYGYGNWEAIVREIRLSEDFMFNYYLKSRDKSEIQKRIDYLVKVFEKEFNVTTEITQNNLLVKPTSSNNLPSTDENEKKRKLNEDDQMVIELENNMRKQAKLQK